MNAAWQTYYLYQTHKFNPLRRLIIRAMLWFRIPFYRVDETCFYEFEYKNYSYIVVMHSESGFNFFDEMYIYDRPEFSGFFHKIADYVNNHPDPSELEGASYNEVFYVELNDYRNKAVTLEMITYGIIHIGCSRFGLRRLLYL